MSINHRVPLAAASIFTLASLLAACGGGGGGGGGTPPVSSPTSHPTSNPTSGPTATSSPGTTESAAGTLAIDGVDLANAPVTFTCGCSQSAGLTTTNGSGGYTVTQTAPAAPSGTGTYTLQGHNVLVIGYATNSNTQAWTMDFVGNTPATDLNLTTSDAAAAAAALYLYYEVGYNATITSSSDRTFDWFNFNTVNAWVAHLRSGSGLTSAETTLLSDISSAQSAGQSLFPYSQTWNPTSDGTNAKIASDLSAVASGGISADATLPTPCPGIDQCTGAPTP